MYAIRSYYVLAAAEPVSAQRLAEIVPGVRAAEVRELVSELVITSYSIHYTKLYDIACRDRE